MGWWGVGDRFVEHEVLRFAQDDNGLVGGGGLICGT
jgi:hypothetical protein